MKLNYRKFGSGHTLFVLHGLFGSSDNWQTVGKSLAEHFTVYLIDLRNHGSSPHDDQMNYKVMSEDLVDLMQSEGLGSAYVIGHSMGGKVAMQLATDHPDRVDKLIVVDIAPKYYPPHHQQIFEGFHSVDLASLETRKDADTQMSQVIKIPAIRQFILKNLDREKDTYSWKINLEVIEENIDEVGQGLGDDHVFEKETLFIGGSNSDYIKPEDKELIKSHFPSAQIAQIKGSGHWVHAEKPNELTEMVIQFLS